MGRVNTHDRAEMGSLPNMRSAKRPRALQKGPRMLRPAHRVQRLFSPPASPK